METMKWYMPSRLKTARERKGFDVQYVARVLDVEPRHILALENQGPYSNNPDEMEISSAEMRTLSMLYDRPEDWLSGISNEDDYVSGPSMEYMPARVKAARKQRGFTQEHVAGELGVPRAHIVALENGTQKKINVFELEKLSGLYEKTLDWLMGYTFEDENEKGNYATHYEGVILTNDPEWDGDAKPFGEAMKLIVEAHNLKLLVGREGRSVPAFYNIQNTDMIDYFAQGDNGLPIADHFKNTKIIQSPSIELPCYLHEFPASTGEAFAQGEYFAELERRRLGLGHSPIDNIVNLLMDQDVLFLMAKLDANVSGISIDDRNVRMAIITNSASMNDSDSNANDSYADWLHHTAQRLSAIHHYARYLFNREGGIYINRKSSDEVIEKNRAVRRDNERTLGFAGAFLLPKLGLDEELLRIGKGEATRKTHFSIDVATGKKFKAESRHTSHSQEIGLHDIMLIAYRFGVSYKMAVLRFASLGYIGPKQMNELLSKNAKDHARLYSTEIRKFDLSPGFDMPSLAKSRLHGTIANLAIEARRLGKISIPQLSQYAKLIDMDANKLIQTAMYVTGSHSGNRLPGKSTQPVKSNAISSKRPQGARHNNPPQKARHNNPPQKARPNNPA